MCSWLIAFARALWWAIRKAALLWGAAAKSPPPFSSALTTWPWATSTAASGPGATPGTADVRKIEGPFAGLLAQGEACPCEDYVELCLTDKSPVLLASQRLRPFYPNLLAVRNQWALEGAAGKRALSLQGAREDAVFAAFFQEVCGTAPEEADMALFQEVWKEVRL